MPERTYKQKPVLVQTPFSKEWRLVTRYKDHGGNRLEMLDYIDVTDQVENLLEATSQGQSVSDGAGGAS